MRTSPPLFILVEIACAIIRAEPTEQERRISRLTFGIATSPAASSPFPSGKSGQSARPAFPPDPWPKGGFPSNWPALDACVPLPMSQTPPVRSTRIYRPHDDPFRRARVVRRRFVDDFRTGIGAHRTDSRMPFNGVLSKPPRKPQHCGPTYRGLANVMAAPKAIGARTAAISMTATVRTRTTRFMYAPASSIGETPGKLFHRDQATKKRNIATRPGAAL